MAGFSIFSDLITPTKYNVPDWAPIDPSAVQLQTAQGNAAAFGANTQLASDYNTFMRQQVAKSLQASIPGYSNITNQISQNIQAGLKGQLSSSDAAAIQRQSGARALAGGTAGSGFSQFMAARDLGLSQYQVQQNAQQQGSQFMQTLKGLTASPMFDFSNVFMSPQQRMQYAFQNQSNQWNIQNMKNQMAVQPAPWEKALANAGDSLLNTAAGAFGGGLLGGIGSPQGGGANYGGTGGMDSYLQGVNSGGMAGSLMGF